MKKKKVLILTLLSLIALPVAVDQIAAEESNPRDNKSLLIDDDLKALDQFALARSYYSGDGIVQDFELAAKLYREVAEQGHPEEQKGCERPRQKAQERVPEHESRHT